MVDLISSEVVYSSNPGLNLTFRLLRRQANISVHVFISVTFRAVFGNFSDIKVPNWWTGIGATHRQNFELPSTAKELPSKGETVYRQKLTVMLPYRRKSTVKNRFTF